MDVEGSRITIGHKTLIDPEENVTITVKVSRDGTELVDDRTFEASLLCAEDNVLCGLAADGSISAATAIVDPYCEDVIGGSVMLNSYIDAWYVPRMFYRLVKVEMYKNHINTSGFKVTYERPLTEELENEGWPVELTHMFGFDDQGMEMETVEFTKDLESITICIDYDNADVHADFEGFEFLEYGESEEIILSPSCPRAYHQTIELTGKRVIGFKAVLSDYLNAPPYR